MDSFVEVSDINSLAVGKMIEETFQKIVNEPNWGPLVIMNKRTSLKLDLTSGVVQVDSNRTYCCFLSCLLVAEFKGRKSRYSSTIFVNTLFDFVTAENDTINFVDIGLRDIGEGGENHLCVETSGTLNIYIMCDRTDSYYEIFKFSVFTQSGQLFLLVKIVLELFSCSVNLLTF